MNEAFRVLRPEKERPVLWRREEGGKPFVPDSTLCFSLSHSGVMAVCAVSEGRIGADIQREDRYNPKLPKRYFTEAEREYISAAGDEKYAFTCVWTRKESYMKYTGKGLSESLRSFDVTGEQVDGCRLWSRKFGEYIISVCARSREPLRVEIHMGRLTEDGKFIENE